MKVFLFFNFVAYPAILVLKVTRRQTPKVYTGVASCIGRCALY